MEPSNPLYLQPHHDGSAQYVPHPPTAVGENFDAFLRVPAGSPVTRVLARQVHDAEPFVSEAVLDHTDPAGNPVPETKLEGTGQAMIFHGGRLVRGTWSKDDLGSPITLSTKAGELTVPAGHTWIELVPVDGGDVTFTKK